MCRFNSLKSCKETFSVPSSLVTLFFISLLLSIIENSAFTTDGAVVLSVENREASRDSRLFAFRQCSISTTP